MRHFPSTAHTTCHARPRILGVASNQPGLMRGLVNGLLLSVAIWGLALYLTFVLV